MSRNSIARWGRCLRSGDQLLTIKELLAGKKTQIPLMERGFKAAAREERDDQPELDI